MDRDVINKAGNIRALDFRIVEIVEVVDNRDVAAGGEQFFHQVRSDEARSAGNQNLHGANVRRRLRIANRQFGRLTYQPGSRQRLDEGCRSNLATA